MQFQQKLRVPIILNWDCKEGLTERVTFEPRLKGHEGTIMKSEEETLKSWFCYLLAVLLFTC